MNSQARVSLPAKQLPLTEAQSGTAGTLIPELFKRTFAVFCCMCATAEVLNPLDTSDTP